MYKLRHRHKCLEVNTAQFECIPIYYNTLAVLFNIGLVTIVTVIITISISFFEKHLINTYLHF